jgi:PAS domain S-box-containing protein
MAVFGFTRFQDGFRLIAESEMPTLINAAELARQSESIVANAPALGGAQTQQVRKTVAFRMVDQVTQFEALADTLFEAGIDPTDLDQLRELKTSLAANLERIDEFVERRLDSDVEGDKTTRRLLDMSKRLRTVEAGVNTAANSLPKVNLWKTNLQEVISLMLAGQAVRQNASLARLREASVQAFGRADTALHSLTDAVAAQLRPLHIDIRRLAVGEGNVFDARAQRLNLDKRVQGALSKNKVISDQFIAVVSNMFFAVQENIRKRVDQYNTLISNRSQMIGAISILCVIGAVTIFFYINGSVVRRLKLLQVSMSAHVEGRTVEIPTKGTDEIADMARSLEFFVDAIERREQALRDSQKLLSTVLDNMPASVFLKDMEGRYRLVNKQFEELHDMQHDHVIGKTAHDLFPKDIADPFVAQESEVLERGTAIQREQRVMSPDGLRTFLEIKFPIVDASGVTNAIGLVGTDITERKKVEQALREKTEFLQLNQVITRAANEAVTVDEAMQIALDQVCDHTGWPVGHVYLLEESTGELASTGIWHLDDPDRFETFRKVTEATRFASGVGLPGRVLTSAQPAWIIDVTKDTNFPRGTLAKKIGVRAGAAFPVLVGRQVAAVMEFFTDQATEPYEPLLEVMAQIGTQLGRVVERTRAETQLLAAKEQAEAATQAKSRFLANMSHELRTPLNVILGVTEIMQEDAEEQGLDDFPEPLGHVSREGKHLLHLIDEILDLSKVEAGRMVLHLEDFDVATLVHDAAVAVQPLAGSNGNRLTVRCPDNLGAMHADMTRVRQVILNLLSNACKFTENGEVILNAARDPAGGRDWLTLTVTDTGIGMTPEQIERLFEEFAQADSSMTRKYGGTGLGLAISRRLCRLMGGDIALTSRLGEGTTCTVRLPLVVKLPAEGLGEKPEPGQGTTAD